MKLVQKFMVVIIILLAMAVSALAEGETPLSLDQCVQGAIASSPSLNASRDKAAAASSSYKLSHAGRLPSLGINGKADWISETMSLTLPLPAPLPSKSIEFGDGRNYDIALALNAPLFTGGSLKSSENAARAEAEASLHDVVSDSLRLVYEVRTAYYRALAAYEAVDVVQQGVDALNRHLVEVEGMIAQGMAGREARILTQARLSDAKRGLVNAQARLRASRYALGQLVGHPGEEVIPEGNLEASLLPDQNRIESPLGSRPDLLALDARSTSSEYRIDAARGSKWPTVSAQAAMHYGKPGIDQVTNEWMDYATVGVRLSWTLYDWGERNLRVQQARSMKSALEQTRLQVEQTWQTRLASARVQLTSTVQERDLAAERLKLNEERLALLVQRYAQGFASESERLDAEDDVVIARRNRVAADANIRLAESDILFILGR